MEGQRCLYNLETSSQDIASQTARRRGTGHCGATREVFGMLLIYMICICCHLVTNDPTCSEFSRLLGRGDAEGAMESEMFSSRSEAEPVLSGINLRPFVCPVCTAQTLCHVTLRIAAGAHPKQVPVPELPGSSISQHTNTHLHAFAISFLILFSLSEF